MVGSLCSVSLRRLLSRASSVLCLLAPPAAPIPPPSVTPDLHHTHIRDVTLQRVRIASCLLRPLSRERSRAAQDLARGIRFRKWLPLPPPAPHKKQYQKHVFILQLVQRRGEGRKKNKKMHVKTVRSCRQLVKIQFQPPPPPSKPTPPL